MENISFNKETLCKPCHDIIVLTDVVGQQWEEVAAKAAFLPRGWYELAQLERPDRIDFTRLFWLSKLPLGENRVAKVDSFFNNLVNIEVFLVQNVEKGAYTPLMLYSTKNNKSSFFGSCPATLQERSRIAAQFSHLSLPEDYLSFFAIHDGFSNASDGGIIKLSDFASYYQRFQERLKNVSSFIPFCELANVHQTQVFYRHGGSSKQMANLFFDELHHQEAVMAESALIFENFLEWLLQYVHS